MDPSPTQTSGVAYPTSFNFGADVIDKMAAVQDGLALIWASADGREARFSFSDIARLSAQLASALQGAGVAKGDRVLVMLPRIPEWQLAMVACLKIGAVAMPCIDMLTAKDIAYRVEAAEPVAVITTTAQVAKFADLPGAPLRVAVGGAAGWRSFEDLLASGDPAFVPVAVEAEDPAVLYFTSGSTGRPKGVLHAARALYLWRRSAEEWLDLKPHDLMWCTADTGWSKAGTSILFGPWSCGSCVFFYDGPFDAAERLRLLARYGVSVFCGSATELLRILDQPLEDIDLSRLRRTVSAGEALSASAAERWREAVGHTVAEAFGQTESLMSIGYRPEIAHRPGSTGKPLAHNEVAVIDEVGRPLPSGEVGEIALRAPNPQLMIGYWRDPVRTEACYVDGPDGRWFRTGDRGVRDADGYIHHRGRGDDVINSAGYRIGPAEVEEVLLAHPAVAEAAAVGAPDPARGEIVMAFVVLREGWAADAVTASALQAFVKATTAPYKYPRAVRFVGELPKTVTGKIQRNLLRDQARRGASSPVASA